MDLISIHDNNQLLKFVIDDPLKAVRSIILTVADHEEYPNALFCIGKSCATRDTHENMFICTNDESVIKRLLYHFLATVAFTITVTLRKARPRGF